MGSLHTLPEAFRTLRRQPGFTTASILTLALGLGANTLILSVINAVVFAPLPYPESERLVVLWEQVPTLGYDELPLSAPDYLDLRDLDTVFEALAVFEFLDATLTGVGRPREIVAVTSSPELFPLLRTKAALGRTFLPTDAVPGSDPVVVLSHGFWQRQLGSDPGVLERRLILNGLSHTVVGVMPADLHFPFPLTWRGRTYQRPSTDVYLARRSSPDEDRAHHRLMALGRLNTGVSVAAANRRLAPAMARLAAAHPETLPPDLGARVVAVSRQASATARPALAVLWMAVLLLLLVGCANVANLLLTRATQRGKEIAVRAAFGASRRHVVCQLMGESLLIGLASVTLGSFVAHWGLSLLSRLSIDELPRLAEARLDPIALSASVALALATTLLFGLAPALYGTRGDLARCLKETGHGLSSGPGRGRLLQGVVVFEVMLCAMLLCVAGWMWRGLGELQRRDPGFDTRNVTAFELPLNSAAYAEEARARYTVLEAIASVSDLPGVEAVGVGSYIPLGGQEDSGLYHAEGGSTLAPGERRLATQRQVTAGFLEAFGTRVLDGRGILSSDRALATPVVLVSQALARRTWPGIEPLGRRLTLDDPSLPDARWWTVVGVVADVRDRRLDRRASPTIYFPFEQKVARRLTMVVRSSEALGSEDLANLAPVIEQAIWSVDPGLPVRLRSLSDLIRESTARAELGALLLGLFAGAALVLAGSGIFAVMLYQVEQRRHEMAIRLAIGARRQALASQVLRESVGVAMVGIGLGLLMAVGLGRLLRGVVYGVSPLDPVVLLGASVIVLGVTVAATVYPAQRVTRVDATLPLRAE